MHLKHTISDIITYNTTKKPPEMELTVNKKGFSLLENETLKTDTFYLHI